MLARLATVQLDSVNVVTRSHELVFFSRLGPYDTAALGRWLWESHEVFEYWGHEASLHPVDRQPLLRWRMAEEHAWGGVRASARENPEMVASALAEVAARGPVGIGDIEVHRTAPRQQEHWWGWGDGKRVVEHLFHTGAITAVRRNGFARAYMVPERWFPARVLAAEHRLYPHALALVAVIGAFSSATQDVVIDAWRIDVADETVANAA